jgi:hypothetical protein
MDRLFFLCKVDILLPDVGNISSHVETYHYVVKPEYFVNFTRYIDTTFDFVGIRKLGNFISSDSKYRYGKFSIL